jgi:ABC-type oligopeptide transport system substrate-binding subunit
VARGIFGFAIAAAFFAVTAAGAADMTKTLRVAFRTAENGFDPQAAFDAYSFYVIGGIFDPVVRLRLLRAPVRMIPNTAAALPEITDQGRTYTIKVPPGIYFAADPAFKGKRRELTADDYVYSFKRILDPKVRSYWLYLFEGNLEGLDEPLAAARKSGRGITTRRWRACARSTASRCRSGSGGLTTDSSGGLRRTSSRPSPARSSRRTRTRRTG